MAAFHETADRLLGMLDRGWVVSRWEDDRAEHTGDSLLWTGMAMGVLDCARGTYPEEALLSAVHETAGALYRHPDEAHRPTSLDGHLGFLWGIAHRVSRCPDSLPRWREAFAVYLASPSSPVGFPFTKVREAVAAQLGLGSAPKHVGPLVDAVAVWAAAVNATKAAAYRIHLGLLSLETLEAAGVGVPGDGRDRFCAATRGVGMPTTEHYCGRDGLPEFLAAFEWDAWEMRHQRAVWESRDGKPGLRTPALDRLVALRALFAPLPFSP